MDMGVKRFEVYIVDLEPTVGHGMRKARPCAIVSADDMNSLFNTVIIAPLTSKQRLILTRVPCTFQGRDGEVVLDQIKVIDKRRLGAHLGNLSQKEGNEVLAGLRNMFEE